MSFLADLSDKINNFIQKNTHKRLKISILSGTF